ncbi:undecaprenyl diphosphate synthase family protein [Marinilactibacillus psychrotolerans]|uniref:UDP pyrophosphate synthase n=1 Tax=Marinilactibacillus psychrotolerans TaxID=191770 RepID=A0A511H2J0_9LACT|nr:undecaprenyl diphosphate synthase family protein [Marinilactibacillus psychrotolerans]TLQ06728.1 undecaprenyl diphosphate synthase family protein [Marinilactibacillus psychrotolerans]GEL67737.1 dihydroorotate dehydrogenase [Marinilactibacillus psychrotolerans]GEQ35593.1 UDP pyrophosphate synthase [Marinilactibacillus psychrotolerans]SDC69649.1 undecaprenyl diphosphate synthase [Marinilactibacillus psychrotolerans]
MEKFKRMPKHIGVIPDGNRRWAVGRGLPKKDGYNHGIDPGLDLYEACLKLGVEEMTFYGFTMDNVKRPSLQTKAFQKACVDSVNELKKRDADLMVIGNTDSKVFPKELLPYAMNRTRFGEGKMKVNFLVNYGWNWDLNYALKNKTAIESEDLINHIASKDISRMDMVLRWGGRRRLSGFLPIQSIYSDIYVINEFWPDYKDQHLFDALGWYQKTDVTLGG